MIITIIRKGNCLRPLLFNICYSTFSQYIKDEKFLQFGYSNNNDSELPFRPVHWFQFADDAAVITGQERENQLLLNCFLSGVSGRVNVSPLG